MAQRSKRDGIGATSRAAKALSEYTARELTGTILRLIGTGALLVSFFALPQLTILFGYFAAHDRRKRSKLAQKMRQLERSGYIARGARHYGLTKKGERELAEYEVWNVAPARSKHPKRWHLVLFDIPVKKERARQALRARLRELGCVRYQDSVFVHRDDVRPALEPFARFYGIGSSLRFVEADALDGEEHLKKHFARRPVL